jgi:hypothetical protein
MLPVIAFTALLAAVSTASAAPAPAVRLPSFHVPEQVYSEVADPSSSRPTGSAIDARFVATEFIASQTNEDSSRFVVTSSHNADHNGLNHVYLTETYRGLPVLNLVSNVNVLDGVVVSAGHSSAASRLSRRGLDDDSARLPAPAGKISQLEAVAGFARAIGASANGLKFEDGKVKGADFALSDIPVALKYYYTSAETLELVYDFSVEQNDHW